MSSAAGQVITERRPVHAAQRLDRLPVSRWLTGVMAILFLGWLVESYDIGLTGSVLPSLTALYHLNTGLKSLVSISSSAGVVLGIVPAGLLADRIGRKRVMVGGTIIYSILTFLTGFAPDIAAVIALRVLAGFAMGAVFPLPYAYAAELCPPNVRGRFTGIADSFLSVGYFLSPLLALLLIPSVTNDTGWRVMFFLGGLPVLFALLAWKYVPESPRWYEAKGRLADAERVLGHIEARVTAERGEPLPAPATPPPAAAPPATKATAPVRELFSRRYLRRSVMLWTTFGGLFFVFYSIQTFMPTVVASMGFTLTSAFAFTAVIVLVSIPGKLAEAWLVERWGRRRVIIVFGTVAAGAALVFGFTRGAAIVLVVGCVMSFFGIGVDPAVKVYTAESYPTSLRATGTSLTEGIGRLFSGVIGPSLVPLLLDAGGVSAVYLLIGAAAIVAVVAVAIFGEETKGRTLETITAPADGPPDRDHGLVPVRREPDLAEAFRVGESRVQHTAERGAPGPASGTKMVDVWAHSAVPKRPPSSASRGQPFFVERLVAVIRLAGHRPRAAWLPAGHAGFHRGPRTPLPRRRDVTCTQPRLLLLSDGRAAAPRPHHVAICPCGAQGWSGASAGGPRLAGRRHPLGSSPVISAACPVTAARPNS